MAKPGRKSAASLTVAPVIGLPRRIEPPPGHLTEKQGDIWRVVMASAAGDWITSDCHPILVEYCRAVVACDQIATELDGFDPAWAIEEEGLKRWNVMTQMQDRAQKTLTVLATKLRITPQSRVHKDKAGGLADRHKGGQRKPWQYENGE